ncbi:hypothetical protein TB1_005403 [Malus domestica]
MDDLFIRQSTPNPICPICLFQEESIVHLLLLCPWVEKSDTFGFVGIMVRDDGGSFMAAVRYAFRSPCVGAAEAMAILKGCEFGLSLRLKKVVVESDSTEFISSLVDSQDNGKWEAFPYLVKAKNLGDSFQNCRWSWILKLANMADDALALQSCSEMCDVFWVNRPPSSLVHILHNDGIPCPAGGLWRG